MISLHYSRKHFTSPGLSCVDINCSSRADWNWDYTDQNKNHYGAYYTHPPCLCGKLHPHLASLGPAPPKILTISDEQFVMDGVEITLLTLLSGPRALETYDWAKAAGMQSFWTFQSRCEAVLHDPSFLWPADVTFVDYPVNDGDEPVTIWKKA